MFYDSKPVHPDNATQDSREAKHLNNALTNILQLLEERTRISESYELSYLKTREALAQAEEINFQVGERERHQEGMIKDLREKVEELERHNASLREEQGLSRLQEQNANLKTLVRWMFDRLGQHDNFNYSCSNQTFFQTGAIRQMEACGMKIDAVKYAREHSDRFNLGPDPSLLAAKEWVESLTE